MLKKEYYGFYVIAAAVVFSFSYFQRDPPNPFKGSLKPACKNSYTHKKASWPINGFFYFRSSNPPTFNMTILPTKARGLEGGTKKHFLHTH